MIRGKLDEPISGCFKYIKDKENAPIRHLYFPSYDGEVDCPNMPPKNKIQDEFQSDVNYTAVIVIEGSCEGQKNISCFRPSYPFDKL